MKQVVRNYAAYRKSTESWLLARLIVPVSRLGEFVLELGELGDQNNPSDQWHLSALPGKDLSDDVATILNFNKEYGNTCRIDVLELKAGSREEIHSASNLIPKTWDVFLEIDVNQLSLIKEIREQGRKAKIRTGGITEGLIPLSSEVARFLATCVHEEVPMKATAGLHHPLRAEQKLTYSPDSRSAVMHGFLNVFLAAALLQEGATAADATDLLEEQDIYNIAFSETSIRWRSWELSIERLADLRKTLLVGFGSCSFDDPLEDMAALNLV